MKRGKSTNPPASQSGSREISRKTTGTINHLPDGVVQAIVLTSGILPW